MRVAEILKQEEISSLNTFMEDMGIESDPGGPWQYSIFAKLFSKKASIKPRQRSGATVHFLCQAFFLAKEKPQ